MLDIKLLRDHAEEFKDRLKTRGGDSHLLIEQLIQCDEIRRRGETEKQALQAERNAQSKQIGVKKKAGEDSADLEAQVRDLGAKLKALAEEVEAADARQRELLLHIPNTPHADCPIGEDENANPVLREWGDRLEVHAELENHVQIAERLGLVDFEAASKVAGSGFALFRGDGARLQRALIQFLLDLHTREHGYVEISPPFVIARDCMIGTGQLPKFEEDRSGTENGSGGSTSALLKKEAVSYDGNAIGISPMTIRVTNQVSISIAPPRRASRRASPTPSCPKPTISEITR